MLLHRGMHSGALPALRLRFPFFPPQCPPIIGWQLPTRHREDFSETSLDSTPSQFGVQLRQRDGQ
jgi:hypothetical protein